MRFSNEIKAGLVIIVAALVGVYFFVKTTDLKRETYELRTSFGYAGDLRENAVVKLSGIEAGRVTDITFSFDPVTRIKCVLELDANVKVRTDAVAYVGTSGFVGDAFLGITAGEEKEFLTEGDVIKSEDPIEMHKLTRTFDDVVGDVGEVVGEIKTLLRDNRDNVDNIIGNLEDTAENLKEMSEEVKKRPWRLIRKSE